MWYIIAFINPAFRNIVNTLSEYQRMLERKLWRRGLIGSKDNIIQIRRKEDGYYVWKANEGWKGSDA